MMHFDWIPDSIKDFFETSKNISLFLIFVLIIQIIGSLVYIKSLRDKIKSAENLQRIQNNTNGNFNQKSKNASKEIALVLKVLDMSYDELCKYYEPQIDSISTIINKEENEINRLKMDLKKQGLDTREILLLNQKITFKEEQLRFYRQKKSLWENRSKELKNLIKIFGLDNIVNYVVKKDTINQTLTGLSRPKLTIPEKEKDEVISTNETIDENRLAYNEVLSSYPPAKREPITQKNNLNADIKSFAITEDTLFYPHAKKEAIKQHKDENTDMDRLALAEDALSYRLAEREPITSNKDENVDTSRMVYAETLLSSPLAELESITLKNDKNEDSNGSSPAETLLSNFPPVPGRETSNLKKTATEVTSITSLSRFRNEPTAISKDEMKAIVKKHNFFDYYWNERAKGFSNQYEVQTIEGDLVVIDRASGLMWQQGGSFEAMQYPEAKSWLEELNHESYAGLQDWRLPTLEEAMSLMEPKKSQGDYYIDSLFDQRQIWIWTSDMERGTTRMWVVKFNYGNCSSQDIFNFYNVRAVRSLQ